MSGGRQAARWPWLLLLLLACTDPRDRPLDPVVEVRLAEGATVASPDTIQATIYAYDADGLDYVQVSALDSTTTLRPESERENFEITRPLSWPVPVGLPAGRTILLVARAVDLAGFFALDTGVVTVRAGLRE